MKPKLTTLLIAIGFSPCFLGQEESEQLKLTRNMSLGVHSLIDVQYYEGLSADQWNTLTPGVKNADEINPLYQEDGFMDNSGTAYLTGVTFQVNVHRKDEPKTFFTPMIRVAIFGGTGYSDSRTWSYNETYRTDTLSSTNTGDMYFIDSTLNYTYTKSVTSNQRYYGLTYLWQTDATRRFSFYGGLGLAFSVSHNVTSNVSYAVNYRVNIVREADQMGEGGMFPNQVEGEAFSKRFMRRNFSGYQISVPLGINVRPFQKKQSFLRNFVFEAELAYTFNQFKIPDIGTFRNPATRISSGLRYCF